MLFKSSNLLDKKYDENNIVLYYLVFIQIFQLNHRITRRLLSWQIKLNLKVNSCGFLNFLYIVMKIKKIKPKIQNYLVLKKLCFSISIFCNFTFTWMPSLFKLSALCKQRNRLMVSFSLNLRNNKVRVYSLTFKYL